MSRCTNKELLASTCMEYWYGEGGCDVETVHSHIICQIRVTLWYSKWVQVVRVIFIYEIMI